MKKNFIIIMVLFTLVSCWKIEPIKSNTNNNTWTVQNQTWTIELVKPTDWVNLNEDVWIKLDEEEEITQRFNLLSEKYKSHTELMWSIQYEQFVKYVYEVFDKYKKLGWKETEKKIIIFLKD